MSTCAQYGIVGVPFTIFFQLPKKTLNLLLNANTIIVIIKPMTLLIRTSQSSKIAPESFSVAITNVVVNHASPLRFFHLFSRFCCLVFQSIQFFRHPWKFLSTTRRDSRHNFFKTRSHNIINKCQRMPVNQTKFVSHRLTVSSPEYEPPLIHTRCPNLHNRTSSNNSYAL
jgi:hypothetical protein